MKHSKTLMFVLAGVLLALLSLNPFGFATASKPITTDTSEPIHVIGRMSVTFNEVDRAEFDRLTYILFEKTVKFDKPVLYTCNEDIYVPGTFVWDEIWSSKDALDQHLASSHFMAWWSWVEPYLSGELQDLYVVQSALRKV